MIKIVSQNGAPVDVAIKQVLEKNLAGPLHSIQAGRSIRESLKNTTRNHFKALYPGSKHYSPDKVTDGVASATTSYVTGSVDIDVPGVTRAYHDLTIVPRFRKYLTIPIHKSAYGKKVEDFGDTFVVKTKKSGNKFIAKKEAYGLTFLYVLKDRVFQKKDSKLMPSDNTFANNIFARLTRILKQAR